MVHPAPFRLPATLRALRIAVIALFIASLVAANPALAVPAPQRPARASLDEWEKLELESLAEKYQEFFDKVRIIMTPEEEEIFLRLESDTQRDEFMTRFWRARDPSAGTPANEYRDEFERRLEYVEKHYGRGTPRQGRDTDQGRMYLLLGEPMNVKTFPWTQEAYPAEIWWYHANPKLGIPPFFYLVFFKRNGVGEFRLYSPLVDGPTALLNPAGMESMRRYQQGEEGYRSQMDGEVGAAYEVLMGVDAELAQVSLSLIPGDYGGQAGYGSMRSQMMMGDIESIPEVIMPTAAWAYPILTGVVEADVRFESLPIRANAIALLDPSGVPFIHYGLLTEGSRLNLNNYEGAYYVTFEVAGTVVDEQNRIVTSIKGAEGATSKILQADLDEEEARRLRGGPIAYLDRLPVVAGDYRFDLVLENNVSREYGRQEFRVQVPRPWPQVLRSSQPLLAWAIYENPDYDPYSPHYPYQVDRFGLIPALRPQFATESGINLFQQLYLPRGHQGMITATYRLLDGGSAVIDRTETIDPATADRNGTINHATNIDLQGVAPGEYQLFIDIAGDDHGGVTLDVSVADELDAEETPYLHMNPGPPPTDPYLAYDRAQQFRSLGLVDDAIDVLSTAIDRIDDDEVLSLQIDLMMEAQRYEEVRQLLLPLQIENPNDTDILMALAAVATQTGENYEAIRYYERVRLVTQEESTEVLNPLASAYYGDGNLVKAREILELSLQVNPEQPAIRRLLDEVLGKEQTAAR
jgi:GWxTD domain-containing protein